MTLHGSLYAEVDDRGNFRSRGFGLFFHFIDDYLLQCSYNLFSFILCSFYWIAV